MSPAELKALLKKTVAELAAVREHSAALEEGSQDLAFGRSSGPGQVDAVHCRGAQSPWSLGGRTKGYNEPCSPYAWIWHIPLPVVLVLLEVCFPL